MGPALAICETAEWGTRIWGIVLPPLLVALWIWVLYAVLRGVASEAQAWLLAAFAASIVVGAAIFLIPDGLSGDTDYLARFELSVAVAVGIGSAMAWFRRGIGWLRAVGAAVAGDVLVPGFLVLLIVFTLSASGTCLD